MATEAIEHTNDAHEGHGDMVKTIWRTFWILLIVTVVEVVAAVTATGHINKYALNGFYIVMSVLKAFYIVGTFMHLKFEAKALMLTILVPVSFLIYAVIVMLFEGNSWLHYKLGH